MSRRLFLLRRLEGRVESQENNSIEKDLLPIGLREEGTCPHCREDSLFSYTNERYKNAHPDPREQFCGYFCIACCWSNAGVRLKIEDGKTYPRVNYFERAVVVSTLKSIINTK